MLFKKKRSTKQKLKAKGFALSGNGSTQTVFDEMEIQLLQLLIQNTSAGTTTSTDEQNKVLGLVKKNSEIQKKQRSDIIIGINRKYAFVAQSKEPIIQKSRSEFDKRSYEYYIDYARVEEIRSFLKMNTVPN